MKDMHAGLPRQKQDWRLSDVRHFMDWVAVLGALIPEQLPGLVLEDTSGLLEKLALINHRRIIRKWYLGKYVCSGGQRRIGAKDSRLVICEGPLFSLDGDIAFYKR